MPGPREGSFLETLCFMNQLPSFRFFKLTPPECHDTKQTNKQTKTQNIVFQIVWCFVSRFFPFTYLFYLLIHFISQSQLPLLTVSSSQSFPHPSPCPLRRGNPWVPTHTVVPRSLRSNISNVRDIHSFHVVPQTLNSFTSLNQLMRLFSEVFVWLPEFLFSSLISVWVNLVILLLCHIVFS
jgi:hypothetical protein